MISFMSGAQHYYGLIFYPQIIHLVLWLSLTFSYVAFSGI